MAARDDLRIQPSKQSTYTRPATDKDLAALGYVKESTLARRALEIITEAGWVKVTEDCETRNRHGVHPPLNECPDCLSGRKLRRGVSKRKSGQIQFPAEWLDL